MTTTFVMPKPHKPSPGWGHGIIMLTGTAGTGKSTFAASFPDHYIFDFDGGLKFIAHTGEPMNTFTRFREICGKLTTLGKEGAFPCKTIIIDTVDMMYQSILDEVAGENAVKITLEQYGKAARVFRRVIRTIKMWPCTKVLICHTKYDNVSGVNKAICKLSSSARGEVMDAADVMGYCDIVDVEGSPIYTVHWNGSMYFEAKDRTGRLPASMKLNYAEFVKAIGGK